MKVLIDHHSPFMLAHGGVQVQVEQTKAALEQIGLEVEWLRWWDSRQNGDLIHFFGVPPTGYQNLVRKKQIPLVSTVLFTETCNRPASRLKLQGLTTKFLLGIPFGESIKNQLTWRSFLNSDCTIVGLNAEKNVLQTVYDVPESRIRVVPIGCEAELLAASPSPRTGDHLICVATITERKRIIDLAETAIAAEVPILFVGKPYDETDPYWLRFQEMSRHSPLIRHQRHTDSRAEMISLLQGARGFALHSQYENWCMVADEAAACGLPLLLPDQNWARERFGTKVRYFPTKNKNKDAEILRSFYEQCPNLPPPPKPVPWVEVGRILESIYREMLSTSR